MHFENIKLNILSLGGGTALLSMFAARAGARHVYCAELSPSLCEIASKCIKLNGYDECVTIIPKHSQDIDKMDMPESADIIVSELMDAGLLGEHIISVLTDARKRYLSPGGAIIPFEARLYGYFVECAEFQRRQILLSPPMPTCNDNSVDSSARSNSFDGFPFARAAARVLSLLNVSLPVQGTKIPEYTSFLTEHSMTGSMSLDLGIKQRHFIVDEEYTCEKTEDIKSMRVLSPVLNLGHVLLSADCSNMRTELSFKSISSGQLHGLVYWFDLLTLPDTVSEKTFSAFSTAPAGEMTDHPRSRGWDQAFLFLVDKDDKSFREVCEGESVTSYVSSTYKCDRLQLKLLCNKDTSNADELSSSEAQSAKCYSEHYNDTIRLGEMDISMLNDWNRTEMYLNSIISMMTMDNDAARKIYIIELCGNWLSFASVILKMVKDIAIFTDFLEVNEPLNELRKIARKYTEVCGLIFCQYEEAVLCLEQEISKLKGDIVSCSETVCSANVYHGKLWDLYGREADLTTGPQSATLSLKSLDVFNSESPVVVVCDLVEGSGLLRQGVLSDIAVANSALRSVSARNIVMIPNSIGIVLSLLQWGDLFWRNRVKSDTTNGVCSLFCGEKVPTVMLVLNVSAD